jgi:hypothetical protein
MKMETKTKLIYVVPAVEVRRVALEVDIVATVSFGPVSAQTEEWGTGAGWEETLGDVSAEGGNMYWSW